MYVVPRLVESDQNRDLGKPSPTQTLWTAIRFLTLFAFDWLWNDVQRLQALSSVTETQVPVPIFEMHFLDAGVDFSRYAALLGNIRPDRDFWFMDVLAYLQNQLWIKILERN